MQIPLAGPAYETVLQQNAQRCINWYPEIDNTLGKDQLILRPTPGLKSFSTITGGTVRGLISHSDKLYTVVDNTFYEVDSAGTETSRGTLNTTSGTVRLAGGNDQVMIVDGTNGYIYTPSTTTLAEITDTDFPASPTYVTYQDGYFITGTGSDQKFYISAVNDGTAWNALDFASAVALPDNLKACVSDRRELWLFGDKSTEVWFNSGNADFPFEKRPGVLIQHGVAAIDSIAQTQNTIYWLAKDDRGDAIVVEIDGYTPRVISTDAISEAIEGYTTVSDAVAYVHRSGKHEFYVLTFPTEDKTWVYDSTTQMWHERQSLIGGSYGRHRGQHYAFAHGKHIVGDVDSGDLLEYDEQTFTENGSTLRRLRRTPTLHNERKLISLYNLVVDLEPGVGILTGQGSDPQIMLRVSKDSGHTWGNYMYRNLGKMGVYNRRVRWDMLGAGRDWVFEFSITDPVEAVLIAAHADAQVGSN